MIRSQLFKLSLRNASKYRRRLCSKNNLVNSSVKDKANLTGESLDPEEPFYVNKHFVSDKYFKWPVKSFKLPPEPDNCCMSGCANCVWIQYAQDLTDLYQVSGDTAKKIIMKRIKDPSMQVFLKMELNSLDE